MADFFRFPHTPHLAWLAKSAPRDDKILSPAEAEGLLAGQVVVEEKMDGANVGLSLDERGDLRAQNRGQYLMRPFSGQFSRLSGWLAQHEISLKNVIKPNLILFGEWCAARHSLNYVVLPDWFLLFDVYDRDEGRFWSSRRRNELAKISGLTTVPEIIRGQTSLGALKQLLSGMQSHYREGDMEGLIVRKESLDWCEARAKLVQSDFIDTIDTHWSKRVVEWNCLKIS